MFELKIKFKIYYLENLGNIIYYTLWSELEYDNYDVLKNFSYFKFI